MRQYEMISSHTARSFNPRTRKGCDAKGYGVSEDAISFNPRTRKGCDFPHGHCFSIFVVSIHAPVKDATI